MPGFDGTGPMGWGPMTGGGRGSCNPTWSGYGPAYVRRPAYGYGFGTGRGFGRGRGFSGARNFGWGMGPGRGWGRGVGRGFRCRRFYPAWGW